MDNLKTLFENEQYELIIDLFANPKTGEEAFYLINSYIQQAKYKIAITKCTQYRQMLFKFSPLKTLRLNFDLRFTLKQFDEAYEDLEVFKNYPYVNQSVEENLRALPSIIRANEKASISEDTKYNEMSILKGLQDSDDYKVLLALDFLTPRNSTQYYDQIIEIVKNQKRHPYIRSYALMLLTAKQYDKLISFEIMGKSYNVIPKLLDKPFTSKEFLKLHDKAAIICKNSSVMTIFDNMIANYQIAKFPDLVENEDTDLLISAVLSICSEKLSDAISKNDLLLGNFSLEELNDKINEIKEIEASIPTI